MNLNPKVAHHDISIDAEGFLISLEDWNEDTARKLAKNAGINLTKEHWEILHQARNYYNDYQSSPANRALVKYIKTYLGKEKGRSIHLMSLFQENPTKIVCKIAGLPKPENCL